MWKDKPLGLKILLVMGGLLCIYWLYLGFNIFDGSIGIPNIIVQAVFYFLLPFYVFSLILRGSIGVSKNDKKSWWVMFFLGLVMVICYVYLNFFPDPFSIILYIFNPNEGNLAGYIRDPGGYYSDTWVFHPFFIYGLLWEVYLIWLKARGMLNQTQQKVLILSMLLFIVIFLICMAFNRYIRGGCYSRLRAASDDIGEQYDRYLEERARREAPAYQGNNINSQAASDQPVNIQP